MNYENELGFLRDILEKCHIHTSILSPNDNIGKNANSPLNNIIGYFSKSDIPVKDIIGNVENKTKYLLSNSIKLRHICLRLPILSEKNILFIGPYLSVAVSQKDVLEIGENAGLSPSEENILKEFYNSLPVISENDRILSVIDAFCEKIWNTPSFAIVEVNNNPIPVLPSDSSLKSENTEEIFADVEIMEMRYSFENELIRAVSLGQQHKENLLATAFNEQMFEKRVQDPLRNAKNYCIIMNTLLRKAAEQGGVHPIHIDKLSSQFAAKIETISDTKKVSDFMKDMFSSYCRLVYKHKTRHFSPIVKKTILVIDSDISAELSLNTLAKKQDVSDGYLATVFKKETGKTISEYIRDRRIEHAKYLLSTTHLQIQTIALHCGIMDVQYFSKIFKKQIGKTPKEYRESLQTQA